MARGHPDYGEPGYKTAGVNLDIGALLVALKGIGSVDGLGRIWFMDTFGEGLTAWNLNKSGNGSLPVASTLESEVPPASMYLDASATTTHTSLANKFLHIGGEDVIGFEVGILYSNTVPTITLQSYYDDGTFTHTAIMQIQVSTGLIVIYDEAFDPVTVGNIPATPAAETWLPVKMVIDYENGVYKRAIFGGTIYQLGQGLYVEEAGETQGTLQFQIAATSGGAANRAFYCGHAILTRDEP